MSKRHQSRSPPDNTHDDIDLDDLDQENSSSKDGNLIRRDYRVLTIATVSPETADREAKEYESNLRTIRTIKDRLTEKADDIDESLDFHEKEVLRLKAEKAENSKKIRASNDQVTSTAQSLRLVRLIAKGRFPLASATIEKIWSMWPLEVQLRTKEDFYRELKKVLDLGIFLNNQVAEYVQNFLKDSGIEKLYVLKYVGLIEDRLDHLPIMLKHAIGKDCRDSKAKMSIRYKLLMCKEPEIDDSVVEAAKEWHQRKTQSATGK